MSKKLTQYWIILAETFEVNKYGPFYSEKEVDDEAKELFKKIKKENPKRAQNIRSMLLLELLNDRFLISVYDPKFLLELS